MKKTKSKRLLTLVLVVVLVFALSVSAFATWSSFQGNNTNSGTIPTSAQPAITSSATVTPVSLPYNNPDYSVYTGVDAASVIQGNYAFTLYNGGVSGANDVGGARMQATNITTTDPNERVLWNIQLDADASNDMQLSTPYYDSNNNAIYAAVTYTTVFQNYTSVSNWSTSGGASISSGAATFTAANQSVSTSLTLTNPVNTIQVSSNLAVTGPNSETTYYAGYTVTLSNGNTTYTLVNNETASSAWAGTYATYNGAQISAGTYTLTFTINSLDTNATATLSTLTMSRYDWRLYSISDANTTNKVLSDVLASGEGQINTHINSIGGYLYFGGFGGEHSYYQYGPIDDENTDPSLTKFTPNTQEDFYYAGASKSSKNNTNYVVFGSESGKVYVRPVGATFGTATGSVINLASKQSACGPIRSSICVKDGVWYLSSRGTGSNGYLWKITDGTTSDPTVVYRQLNGNSTSTPVVSNNNYVYVGYSSGYSSGGVVCVPANFTSSTTLTSIYSGHPVQSSPLVYTYGGYDYVYFTTNHENGKGYCYSWYAGYQATIANVWALGGTSGNPYAVQGFSSENGYLVYGDDGNYLYIIH